MWWDDEEEKRRMAGIAQLFAVGNAQAAPALPTIMDDYRRDRGTGPMDIETNVLPQNTPAPAVRMPPSIIPPPPTMAEKGQYLNNLFTSGLQAANTLAQKPGEWINQLMTPRPAAYSGPEQVSPIDWLRPPGQPMPTIEESVKRNMATVPQQYTPLVGPVQQPVENIPGGKLYSRSFFDNAPSWYEGMKLNDGGTPLSRESTVGQGWGTNAHWDDAYFNSAMRYPDIYGLSTSPQEQAKARLLQQEMTGRMALQALANQGEIEKARVITGERDKKNQLDTLKVLSGMPPGPTRDFAASMIPDIPPAADAEMQFAPTISKMGNSLTAAEVDKLIPLVTDRTNLKELAGLMERLKGWGPKELAIAIGQTKFPGFWGSITGVEDKSPQQIARRNLLQSLFDAVIPPIHLNVEP